MKHNIIELHYKCRQCKHGCRTEIVIDTQGAMLAFDPRCVCIVSSVMDKKVIWEPVNP